jgi:hypothetical protein
MQAAQLPFAIRSSSLFNRYDGKSFSISLKIALMVSVSGCEDI